MMAAAQSTHNRLREADTSIKALTAALWILLILAAEAEAAPSLFKNVKPLAVQPGVAAAAAPGQAVQYALPQDVQVLSMAAPGGELALTRY